MHRFTKSQWQLSGPMAPISKGSPEGNPGWYFCVFSWILQVGIRCDQKYFSLIISHQWFWAIFLCTAWECFVLWPNDLICEWREDEYPIDVAEEMFLQKVEGESVEAPAESPSHGFVQRNCRVLTSQSVEHSRILQCGERCLLYTVHYTDACFHLTWDWINVLQPQVFLDAVQ